LSNVVFPVLNGLTWSRYKTPGFSTKIQTAISGKEMRAPYWTYPRWTFKLKYEFIEDNGTTEGDLQKIAGFFLSRKGSFDDFLYQDPEDYIVTDQTIGVGDGVTTEFQLIRSFGGFVEPVFGIDAATLKLYLDGLETTAFTVNNYGLVTFTTAPDSSAAITADFNFYFRCRFTKDEMELEEFVQALYQLNTCEFKSLKL
jgi:uncharacterized protein (TIGR02217 family)